MEKRKRTLFYDWCILNHKEQYIKEFDDDTFDIKKLTCCSTKLVWWKCPQGHRYQMKLYYRTTRGNGCPYCSGHRVLIGFNDLKTTHPDLAKEWDYEKNNGKKPEEYSKGAISKVWWKCEKGHSFLQSINTRTFQETKCPYCSNQKLLIGYNDLQSRFPSIAKEWDYEKNNPIVPSEVFPGTIKKYWWVCPFGHHYLASPNKRTDGIGTNCPVCDKEKKVSFPEKIIYYYVKMNFPDAVENYHPDWKSTKNIDVYIKKYNLGIEYDGEHWHKDIKKDISKNELCQKNGIKLIRIRENGCPRLNHYSQDYYFNSRNYDELINVLVQAISEQIGENIIFDEKLDDNMSKIVEMTTYSFKGENIEVLCPNECLDWDYEKNGDLKPSMFTPGSPKKVWWKCSKGHSYLASIYNHCSLKHKCPYCTKIFVEHGVNDLAHTNPDILKYWDYDKNTIDPENIMPGSGKKAYWKCDKGHEFIRPIRDMVSLNRCIICDKLGNRKTTGKPVLCYDLNMNFIKEYESVSAAARDLSVHSSAISSCCNGLRKKAYGYIWIYKE